MTEEISDFQLNNNLICFEDKDDIRCFGYSSGKDVDFLQNDSEPIPASLYGTIFRASSIQLNDSDEEVYEIAKQKIIQNYISKPIETEINETDIDNKASLLTVSDDDDVVEVQFTPKEYIIFTCLYQDNKNIKNGEDESTTNSEGVHKLIGKKRNRKKRKEKPDDIRKKIKSRFHKTLKNLINHRLKLAGSVKFFDFLPQCFVCNIAKNRNKTVLHLTYEQLLTTNFAIGKDFPSNKTNVDTTKFQNNLHVLKYLKKNPDILEKSKFDLVLKTKYVDLLREYFNSEEFKKSVHKLKIDDQEPDEYINEYCAKAQGYINFFQS